VKAKLDVRTVSALALPEGKTEDFVWDTELTGFGLRLRRRSGGGVLRTFVAQYRAAGRTRRSAIGDAEKITLTQARDAGRKLLARVELGGDPQAERREQRQRSALSFRSAAETYLAATAARLRPESRRLARLYLLGGPYFRPLHASGIGDISHRDLAARLSAITTNHSAHTAAAARRSLSAFFRWCIEEGWRDGGNPVSGTRKGTVNPPRDHVPTIAELAAIWNACDGLGHFGLIVRLLILLGSRRAEIGGMAWSECDLEAGTWTLPAERSKNHRAHSLALPGAALAIIRSVPRVAGRDQLFGERAAAGFSAFAAGKAALDRRLAGTVRPFRLHDLRRAAATGLADIGVAPHVVEEILNHQSGHKAGVAGIYNRSSYQREAQQALLRWAEHLAALTEQRAAKVVPLPQRA
jgi:integrase